MIKSSVEKMAGDIGYDIGHSDDQVQADLLNGFCRALKNGMPDNHDIEMQICYIVDKLSPDSFKILELFADFIKAKKDD